MMIHIKKIWWNLVFLFWKRIYKFFNKLRKVSKLTIRGFGKSAKFKLTIKKSHTIWWIFARIIFDDFSFFTSFLFWFDLFYIEVNKLSPLAPSMIFFVFFFLSILVISLVILCQKIFFLFFFFFTWSKEKKV